MQKEVYMKAVSHWIDLIYNVDLPHTHASVTDGLTDGHRLHSWQRTDKFLKYGWAGVVVVVPGTGCCQTVRYRAYYCLGTELWRLLYGPDRAHAL